MTLTRALWCLIAAFFLLPTLAHAQAPIQVPSKRVITGMPPLFESQPDREIPGRFVGFTASGCALSFSATSVRGLSWSGACSGGRMHGQGTVMGYDYEQQPIFIFEGFIDRGLRKSGVMYEVHRKDGVLIGWRTEIVGSALQPHTEVRFLDMPRPFLLALDDWNRQTDGKDLLASMLASRSLPSVCRFQSSKASRKGRGISRKRTSVCGCSAEPTISVRQPINTPSLRWTSYITPLLRSPRSMKPSKMNIGCCS